jgi:hypothetical protein
LLNIANLYTWELQKLWRNGIKDWNDSEGDWNKNRFATFSKEPPFRVADVVLTTPKTGIRANVP